MYANADLHYTSPDLAIPAPGRVGRTRGLSIRQAFKRVLYWLDSGAVQPHMVKADHGHGTDFMLIHGHVVPSPSGRDATGADQYAR